MLRVCAQVAFNLLEDMRASGLTPSTPTCSALIYACLQNNNFAAARKVRPVLARSKLLASFCQWCIQHAYHKVPLGKGPARKATRVRHLCTVLHCAVLLLPMYRSTTR
jgi:hypothetical protein